MRLYRESQPSCIRERFRCRAASKKAPRSIYTDDCPLNRGLTMDHIALAIFGIAFWAFLAIASVAGIVADYKKRRLELEPLRAAIERGQQLDPALVQRLM